MFPWKVSEIIDDQESSAFIGLHVSHNVSDKDGSALIELKNTSNKYTHDKEWKCKSEIENRR